MPRPPHNPNSAQAKRNAAIAKERAQIESNWKALFKITKTWSKSHDRSIHFLELDQDTSNPPPSN